MILIKKQCTAGTGKQCYLRERNVWIEIFLLYERKFEIYPYCGIYLAAPFSVLSFAINYWPHRCTPLDTVILSHSQMRKSFDTHTLTITVPVYNVFNTGTVPVYNVFSTGTVPVYNVFKTGTVPVYNVFDTGTVPVYNFFLFSK